MASSCINTVSDCSLNQSHDCLLMIHIRVMLYTTGILYTLDKKSHMNKEIVPMAVGSCDLLELPRLVTNIYRRLMDYREVLSTILNTTLIKRV